MRGTGVPSLPGGSADDSTLARHCVQSRESAGGPDCQDAMQDDRKKSQPLRSANARNARVCRTFATCSLISPCRMSPIATCATFARTAVGVHLPSAKACVGGIAAGATREPAAQPSRVVR
ncbi:hypothetical protein XFF4834R_chr38240 [Xanthomonas citri pv. fuscans]|nr:hypothetical protein XFF4834R_chr38240 [Xanthomonas citri pv. fuscans]